jgi:hypothetical protein
MLLNAILSGEATPFGSFQFKIFVSREVVSP